MKLTPANRQELTSATITQALGLTLICSLVFVIAAPASQPAWWSSRGATHAPVVTTNSGIVTTNYVLNDYATVTQGQLKQFTARAADELNANLTNYGAGSSLTNLVYGWTRDYATNGYNASNLKPADYNLVTVGQLKYVGSLVYSQLSVAGYSSLSPSWLTVNTNTDNSIALIGQLKQVFDFDLSTAHQGITGLIATASNPGEIDLNWTLPTPNTATSILIQESTDGGLTWTTVDTLSNPSLTSYAVTGLTQGASYTFRTTISNTSSGWSASSQSSSSVQAPATPRYAVIDLGTNFGPAGINSSGMVAGNTTNGAAVWSQGATIPLNPSALGPGTAMGLDDAGEIVGSANFTYAKPTADGDLYPGEPASVQEIHACYWANTNADPLDLDQQQNAFNQHNGYYHYYPIQDWYTSMAGSIVNSHQIYGTAYWDDYNHASLFDVSVLHQTNSVPSLNGTGGGFAGSGPNSWGYSAAGTNWCGIYYDLAGHTTMRGFHIDGATNMLATNSVPKELAINTNGLAVGWYYTNSPYGTQAFTIRSGVMSNFPGNGFPGAINDATTTTITGGITNVVATPQIIGSDTNGAYGVLWEQSMYDGTPTTNGFYIAKNLNKLIPGASGTNPPPWNVTSAIALNNSGAIVGQATYSGPATNIAPGPHGIMLLPFEYIRETTPGSGQYTTIDQTKGALPVFHPDTSQNNDETTTGGYVFTAQLSQNLSSTSTASMVVAFQNAAGSFSGTLTETATGSGIFHDSGSTFTLTLTPTTQTTGTMSKLNVQVTDSTLGLSNAPFLLSETGHSTLNFAADVILAEVDLSGTLSTTAVNTISVHLSGSLDNNSSDATLTETGINTRIFTRSLGDMTVTINSLSGTAMQITVQNNFLKATTATLALVETTASSNVFANITVTSSTFTALDPGSSGQGVFYMRIKGFSTSVPITLTSGANSITVNATPVTGSPGTLMTPPLALLQAGSSGTYSGITTLQMDSTATSVCASIFGSKVDPPVTGGAYIGRALNSIQMPGGRGHLNAIETTLINKLGWTVVKNQVVTNTDVTSSVSKYSLFYFFGHGATPDGTANTPFKAFVTWENFFTNPLAGYDILPSAISSNLGNAKYKLVFINGCASADPQAGSNASAFATAFGGTSNSEAYVGWTTEVNMYEAGGDGPLFFEELDNGNTVAEAIRENNSQHGSADTAELKALQGQDKIIDLTP